jgi:AraC-like DNA-binding protein
MSTAHSLQRFLRIFATAINNLAICSNEGGEALKGSRVYVRTFIYMLTITLVVILLGCSIYYVYVRNLVRSEMMDSNQQIIKQMASSYEVFLESTINATMVSIQSGPDLAEMANDPTSKNRLIYGKLNQISELSDFIYSIYYIDLQSEDIYTSSGFRFDKSDFYDQDWVLSLDANRDFYILPSRQLPTIPSGVKDVIPIILNAPFHALQHEHMYVINIDANQLLQYLIRSMDSLENQNVRIIDPTGMIFVSTDRPDNHYMNVDEFPHLQSNRLLSEKEGGFLTDHDGKRLLISHYESPQYGWKYVYEADYEQLALRMMRPLQVVLLIAVILLAFGIFAAMTVSKRLYRPVGDLVQLFGPQVDQGQEGQSVDEYDWIAKQTRNYLSENQDLKEEIDHNQKAMEKHFLYNLVVRNIYTEQEIDEKLTYFQSSIYNNYSVIVIGIDDYPLYMSRFTLEDRMLWEYAIENIATELWGRQGSGFYLSLDVARFAIVFSATSTSEPARIQDEAFHLANELMRAIHDYLHLFVSIGVGRPLQRVDHMYIAYQEAVTALSYAEASGGREVVTYSGMQGAHHEIEYPYELEKTLMQHIAMGDLAAGKKQLLKIYSAYEIVNAKYGKEQQLLGFQLLNAIMRKMAELDIAEQDGMPDGRYSSEICREILQANTAEEAQSVLLHTMESLCTYIQQRRDNMTNTHVKQMLDYIQDNLHEPLSVDSIADYIGLNRMYTGRLFKQYTNHNIADYINQVRIEKAVELLETTDMKVKDIAATVGFNNTHYFIRIFKKIKQVTPGAYMGKREDTIKD